MCQEVCVNACPVLYRLTAMNDAGSTTVGGGIGNWVGTLEVKIGCHSFTSSFYMNVYAIDSWVRF